MPKYNHPPRAVILQETKTMIKKARNERDKTIVRVLWLYGMRPAEAVMLNKENFSADGDTLILEHITVKHKNYSGIVGENKKIVNKEVSLSKDPFAQEIWDYVCKLKDGVKLFSAYENSTTSISPERIKTIIYELSKCGECEDCNNGRKCSYAIPPYFFRHNRNTNLADVGASIKDLMDWNGWDSPTTAGKYLRREPVRKFKGKIF